MSFQEKVVANTVCKTCLKTFPIYEGDVEALSKLSPVIAGTKYDLPLPVDCPNCRRQKRLSWRNTAKLYRRKCDFTGKPIVAFYDETVAHPVYDINVWNGDKWNPWDYGRDFDFSRPFFEQFRELKNVVPTFSRSIQNFENSEYCNNAANLKNCYLCFNGWNGEDCYYAAYFKDAKDCIDCCSLDSSENCYECVDCTRCNKLFFSQDCVDCDNSHFLKNCNHCSNCFGCKNLTNQEYRIFNEPVPKDEYEQRVRALLEGESVGLLRKKCGEFFLAFPEKFLHGFQAERVTGDYVQSGKDVFFSFDIVDGEDLRYCTAVKDRSKRLVDVDIFGWGLENCYNSVVVGHESSNLFCSFDCWEHVNDLYYCSTCLRNVSNCFGCIGLHDGQEYGILNKRYTKEEYEALVPKIIAHMKQTGEWGEFFPPSISSYGYNQTEGYVTAFMDRKEALKRGFNWSDYEPPFPKVEKTIPASKLPDDIRQIPDDILNWAVECEVTKKPFRIIKQELEFYRKHNLPLPKRHPDERYLDRIRSRNPRELFERACDCPKCEENAIAANTSLRPETSLRNSKTGKTARKFVTSYSPERLEKVYCAECYEREIS